MTPEYDIPSFLGRTEPTRDQHHKQLVAEARQDAIRLVRDGILHPDFVRRVQETEPTNHVLTFSNVVNGDALHTSITVNLPTEDGPDPFTVRVYMHSPTLYEEDETISVSTAKDLETAIKRGKSLMSVYKTVEKKQPTAKAKTSLLQVRIEEELKAEFEKACADADESQARVIRRLIKYYLGQGPDPKMSK
jgi:hypothetical protein